MRFKGETVPRMKPAGAWVLAAAMAFAASAAAQSQPVPQMDPKASVPATVKSDQQPAPRIPSAGGRNQFFTPVMGIDIKGEGLALPAGVAPPEEPLIPAKPPAAATPPATAK